MDSVNNGVNKIGDLSLFTYIDSQQKKDFDSILSSDTIEIGNNRGKDSEIKPDTVSPASVGIDPVSLLAEIIPKIETRLSKDQEELFDSIWTGKPVETSPNLPPASPYPTQMVNTVSQAGGAPSTSRSPGALQGAPAAAAATVGQVQQRITEIEAQKQTAYNHLQAIREQQATSPALPTNKDISNKLTRAKSEINIGLSMLRSLNTRMTLLQSKLGMLPLGDPLTSTLTSDVAEMQQRISAKQSDIQNMKSYYNQLQTQKINTPSVNPFEQAKRQVYKTIDTLNKEEGKYQTAIQTGAPVAINPATPSFITPNTPENAVPAAVPNNSTNGTTIKAGPDITIETSPNGATIRSPGIVIQTGPGVMLQTDQTGTTLMAPGVNIKTTNTPVVKLPDIANNPQPSAVPPISLPPIPKIDQNVTLPPHPALQPINNAATLSATTTLANNITTTGMASGHTLL